MMNFVLKTRNFKNEEFCIKNEKLSKTRNCVFNMMRIFQPPRAMLLQAALWNVGLMGFGGQFLSEISRFSNIK